MSRKLVLENALRNVDRLWVKRKRCLDSESLFKCLVGRMGLGRGIWSFSSELSGACSSAVSRALRKVPENAFGSVFQELRTHRQQIDGTRKRPRVLALDGSVVYVPRSFQRYGYRSYHRREVQPDRRGARPIGLLSCLVDVETRELVAYKWGEKRSERVHAAELFQSVGSGNLVVMDRGYFSQQLLSIADAAGIKVLFRLRSNANKETKQFISSQPVAGSRRRRTSKTVDVAGVRARLFQYRAQQTVFTCLTTSRRTTRQLMELYRKRWSVESWFRSWKGGLRFKHRVSHNTTSPTVFRHALDCSMIYYELMVPITERRFHRRASPAFAKQPSLCVPAQRDAVLSILWGSSFQRLFGPAWTSFSHSRELSVR